MIFVQEQVTFQLLEVLEIHQQNKTIFNTNRNFDALSLRVDSDTIIETKESMHSSINNSIIYVPSNVNYSRKTLKDNIIVIHFKCFNYHANDIEVIHPENINHYKELFEEINQVYKKKQKGYLHQCSSILNRIFLEIYKENHEENTPSLVIQKSVKYLKKNLFNSDLSVKEIADQSNVSEVYFRRLFKKCFFISPKQYIITNRIQYAASLVNTGYYSLQEISDLCGFNDYKYFLMTFKKIVGVSPTKYKYNFCDILD